MKRILYGLSAALIILGYTACQNKPKPELEKQPAPKPETQKTTLMKSYVSIFEIPASDISRAIKFYETILAIDIEKMEFPEVEMGLLPMEDQMVVGVIMKGEGYTPSPDGVTVYLNGGNDLKVILDKVESSGGKILIPKTPHADEVGFFAIFIDSEGNKIGLHSPN
ncbi:VOC family protein [Flagellimonas onchidii]|uniref:VOC family protein n=1 Tax=Flagellimonas onchidii TaxID=2562684 RepID=UPI00197A707B|nr:VOC family protein [Allomuricauda onchidii]